MKRKHDHHDTEHADDEVSMDLSGAKEFFRKVDIDKVVLWTFLLFSLVLVFSIRMLPSDLPVTDDWAGSTINNYYRSQVAAQIDQQFPALPQQNRDALIDKQVNELLAQQKDQIDATQDQLSQQYKSALRYTGEDGKEYTYLGDLDSYFWIRYTRNLLTKGTACDQIVDGTCRDMYVLAPVGAEGSFNPSFHVFGIYGLYKVMTAFNPQYPLPATSFLVQALIGAIAIIPAFFIGRRLAGNVAGLFAALLVGLQPLFLSRSLGSDTDVWIIPLSLFAMWMTIEALEAKSMLWRVVFAALAGGFIAWLSAAWEGWWFIYLVLFFALVGATVFTVLVAAVRERKRDFWKSTAVQRSALILGVFYVAAFIFLVIADHGTGYFKVPGLVLSTGAQLDRAIVQDFWPNVLTTVAELNKSNFFEAMNSMGGKLFFFLSLAGMLLMILPRDSWGWRQYALFIGGGILYVILISTTSLGKFAILGLLALPIAAILLAYLWDKHTVDIAPALIVLVWLLASVYASYSGVRFILLMIPAFAIGAAVAAGRAYEWISAYLRKELPWNRYITNALVFALIALLLVQPIRAGRDTARGYVPSIDDAWWDGLTKIRQESSPDAIINSWWDFGHWFKYVADRRVTADGTTQHTHAPRWLGLALVSPDEDETMGVLRMLDCGNDAFPTPDGEKGAYGRVLQKVNDSVTAQRIVREIILMDRAEARGHLAGLGFTAAEQTSVLEASHCDPPENYFITSGDMIGKAGVWAHFGLWNFTKAYAAQHSRNLQPEEAIPDLQQRFGMSAEEAEKLYWDTQSLTDEGQLNAFAAPWPQYVTGGWVQCQQPANSTTLQCPLGIGISQQGDTITAIDAFIYNGSDPQTSRFRFGVYRGGQRASSTEGAPYSVIIADERIQEIRLPNASMNSVSVLVDVPNKRVLVADPALARSMFTQLYYLDGRYSQHFEKFYDANGLTGNRVLIWKVNWEGRPSPAELARNTTDTTRPAETARAANATSARNATNRT